MTDPSGGARGSRLSIAAAMLAASVLLSRVMGYLREAVLAHQVGASAVTDAYYAAFQIPDLLNYFLAGGALSIAFVPLYTGMKNRSGAEAADRLFATVLGTLGVLSVVTTAVLWWYAQPLVALQFPRFSPETQALTVRLTRIVLPGQVFFVTGAIVRAVLMVQGRFLAQALAPILYNGAIITGGLLLGPSMGVEGFAWGVLAGAVLGPFLIPLLDARGRIPLRLRVAPLDRDFLRYMVVAAPLMLGLTLLTVDEWYERWFGALLSEGTVAYLGYARRLMQVPVAVVGQALAVAALPTLARLWTEGRREELNRVVLRTLQVGMALALVASVAFFVFAGPVVEIVYQRGRFTPADTARVAAILAVLSLAVPAWVAQQIAARAYFARGDTWRPMLIGTGVALGVIPLYLAAGPRFGAEGLAAAGALGMTLNAVLTLVVARRLHGAPRATALLGTVFRAGAIAAAAGFAAARVQPGRAGVAGALIDVAAGGAVFALVTGLGFGRFGDEAMREAIARLWARRRGRRPA